MVKSAPLKISVERNLSPDRLSELGVQRWPIWSKGISEFPWHYSETETCYLLEGEVTIISSQGEAVTLQAGDLVTFPAGLSCTWKITQAVSKHYTFATES